MKRLILIDNFDSFTYNVLHYFGQFGADVEVIRNNAMSADHVLAKNADGIVISPGPASPNEAGICLELIEKAAGKTPLLGICLGHQAIGQVFGGKVIRADAPMHGKTSEMFHEGKGVFAGLPSPFIATRYHSLIVEQTSLPDCLEMTANTADGTIMGLQHKIHAIHGVQFHPESIASEHGHALLKNFLNLL